MLEDRRILSEEIAQFRTIGFTNDVGGKSPDSRVEGSRFQLVLLVQQVLILRVGGRHQLENGRFAQIDIDSVLARSNEWRDRIIETGEID